MGTLKIERSGGVAGFGPKSRVQSSGEVDVSALSADDQAKVESLFNNPELHQGSGLERDDLRYHITRMSKGKSQTIVVPKSVVPPAIRACVKDKLT